MAQVPAWFQGVLASARRGRDSYGRRCGYANAGAQLARHWQDRWTEDEVTAAVAEFEDIDREDDDGALGWLLRHLPAFVDSVPRRRRADFARGFSEGYAEHG